MRISDWSSDVCSSDLGAIEREISGADQHFRGSPVTRADRDADRGTDVERILIDLVGPRQRFDDGDREFLDAVGVAGFAHHDRELVAAERSEEHTSELQSLMRISYAVFCLKKKNKNIRKISKQRERKSVS